MGKLEPFIARRRQIAAMYDAALDDLGQLILPGRRNYVEPGWHLYVVRVADKMRRKAFFERLRALSLGVQVHYIPVHYHPYYQSLGYQKGTLPVAEDCYARAVSLPLYPQMSDDDVGSSIDRVRQAVKDVL